MHALHCALPFVPASQRHNTTHLPNYLPLDFRRDFLRALTIHSEVSKKGAAMNWKLQRRLPIGYLYPAVSFILPWGNSCGCIHNRTFWNFWKPRHVISITIRFQRSVEGSNWRQCIIMWIADSAHGKWVIWGTVRASYSHPRLKSQFTFMCLLIYWHAPLFPRRSNRSLGSAQIYLGNPNMPPPTSLVKPARWEVWRLQAL